MPAISLAENGMKRRDRRNAKKTCSIIFAFFA